MCLQIIVVPRMSMPPKDIGMSPTNMSNARMTRPPKDKCTNLIPHVSLQRNDMGLLQR